MTIDSISEIISKSLRINGPGPANAGPGPLLMQEVRYTLTILNTHIF